MSTDLQTTLTLKTFIFKSMAFCFTTSLSSTSSYKFSPTGIIYDRGLAQLMEYNIQ